MSIEEFKAKLIHDLDKFVKSVQTNYNPNKKQSEDDWYGEFADYCIEENLCG